MGTVKLVSAEILKNWLDTGKKISLVDIRPASQRSGSSIPGSIHVDVYDKLKRNDHSAFDSLYLYKSIPVVTFCGGGKASITAAEMLAHNGYNAYSLYGGLEGWNKYSAVKSVNTKTSVFDNNAQDFDSWFENHPVVFQNELEALRKVIPQQSMGIEIGIGTGRFAEALKITIGAEPAHAMAQMAIARGLIVINAKAESLPLHSQSFDYVLMVTTVCFLDDIPKACAEAHRIIKKNGYIIIGLIDSDSELGKQYAAKKKSNPWYKNAHFHSVKEITELMQASGFTAFEYWQTLFGNKEELTEPQPGFGNGSFVVIRSQKM